MNLGVTLFGVVRKRMDDLLRDFNERIKKPADGSLTGAFGAVTTLDTPDQYASDALVQLATTASASDSELWEATEFMYNQLDFNQAEGKYLERIHGIPRLGLAKDDAESWDEYTAKIRRLLTEGAERNDPATAAMSIEGITCAKQIHSTTENPIDGITAPGSMLIIKSCEDLNYSEVADELWKNSEIGSTNLIGDVQVNYVAENGTVLYRFQPACRIFVDVRVEGYFSTEFGVEEIPTGELRLNLLEVLESQYADCGFGQSFTSSFNGSILTGTSDFVVTAVRFRRRAMQLYFDDCPIGDEATMVEVCGEVIPWASHQLDCTFCKAETWCESWRDCLELNPWEFPDFDLQFISVAMTEPEVC